VKEGKEKEERKKKRRKGGIVDGELLLNGSEFTFQDDVDLSGRLLRQHLRKTRSVLFRCGMKGIVDGKGRRRENDGRS